MTHTGGSGARPSVAAMGLDFSAISPAISMSPHISKDPNRGRATLRSAVAARDQGDWHAHDRDIALREA
jgi:hypothetical protein